MGFRSIVLLAAFLALVPAALAQVPNEGLANSIIAARQKSNAMLQQYTWNVRTEILKNGSAKDTRIQQVSYGANGVPQYTLLNDTGSSMPRGFFRRAIAENEKEEMEKYLKGLQELVGKYTLPSAGATINFLSTAKIVSATSPEGRAILQTTGNGVVIPGDTLAFTFDAASFAVRRMDITTTFDGQPVTMTATFRTLPSGLTHMQYATVDVPGKSLSVQMHNYDYVPND